jgi:hypothetical protein
MLSPLDSVEYVFGSYSLVSCGNRDVESSLATLMISRRIICQCIDKSPTAGKLDTDSELNPQLVSLV